MKEIDTFGIRDLSNSVSAYIRKAALGVRVLISDRGRVVAELLQPGTERGQSSQPLHNGAVAELVQSGTLALGTAKKVSFPKGTRILKAGVLESILDELRADR